MSIQATGRSGGDRRRRRRRRRRTLLAAWVLVGLVCLGRTAQLQLGEAERWRQVAGAQTAAHEKVPAQRGGFYDRDGTPVVRAAEKYRGYLAPKEVGAPRRAAAEVGRILGLDRSQQRRLATGEGWNPLPRLLTLDERDRLRTAVRRGLYFEPVTDRVFPQGPLARPLLGSVSPEGEGRSGLELTLDSLLRGTPGEALRRRDARGGEYRLPDAEITRSRPGHDVRLTLDIELQKIAEDALERALQNTGASGGDVLMLDPETGELLALASRRMENRSGVPAFAAPYEPGSTLKPFLLASLLDQDRVRLGETIDVNGGVLRRHGRTIRDVHPEDSLTVAEVILHSSNVGAAKLSSRLSPALQYRYLRDFGFGLPTGITHPSEAAGRLRRPSQWSALSQASLAMGYEVSVTSLQLAAAYGALANGGVLMRPYLVKEIQDAEGEVVKRNRPEPVRRVVSPEVADRVTGVLSSVVEGGTGTRAALRTLPVAGKTGTARVAGAGGYQEGRYAASFVGYTPVEGPRLVVLIKLDDPQGQVYGGLTAAPISRSTLQAALSTRGVAFDRGRRASGTVRRLRWERDEASRRDDGPFVFAVSGSEPARTGSTDPGDRRDDRERRLLPDLRGLPLRAAAARLHELGLRVTMRAEGRIRGQEPSPGTEVRPGETVVLR